jgi:hypothetical protein
MTLAAAIAGPVYHNVFTMASRGVAPGLPHFSAAGATAQICVVCIFGRRDGQKNNVLAFAVQQRRIIYRTTVTADSPQQ